MMDAMAQITLYLDEETDALLTRAASASGLSKSRWVARAIRSHADDALPDAFRRLAGAFPDFPLQDRAADARLPPDAPRIGF
jgi:hypothetical protein